MGSWMKSCLIIFFACSLFIHASLAEVICENLPENLCAFAVASSGKRCSLKRNNDEGAADEYMCTTSEVVAVESLAGHLESDQCVAACGAERRSVGISPDASMTPDFIFSLCSPPCYHNCPNIVDFYFNPTAYTEGLFLPEICAELKSDPRRSVLELLGINDRAPAPAPSPSSN